MSKNKNRNQKPVVTFASTDRRMPKGWKFLGDNEMREPKKSYAEKYRDSATWHKMMLEAEKHNKLLGEELKKKKDRKKKDDTDTSNAENLIEKKYHKDKNKAKIAL